MVYILSHINIFNVIAHKNHRFFFRCKASCGSGFISSTGSLSSRWQLFRTGPQLYHGIPQNSLGTVHGPVFSSTLDPVEIYAKL